MNPAELAALRAEVREALTQDKRVRVSPDALLWLLDNQRATAQPDIEALRAAHAEVGGGPWTAERVEHRLEWWVVDDQFGHILNCGYVGNGSARPTAELLALAFNSLPALLDELAALRPTPPVPPVVRTFDERMAFEKKFDADLEAHRKGDRQ